MKTSKFNSFILARKSSSLAAGVIISVVEDEKDSTVVVVAKNRLAFVVAVDVVGARLPPRAIIPQEVLEVVVERPDEKLAADGLETNANRAVAATCRNRCFCCFASLGITDNM